VRTIKVDTHRVKLQIWDTAGHERFRAITKSYYRGADVSVPVFAASAACFFKGVLLVYDLTSTTSFDSITGWMASLNEHCERTVPRIIVGNKSDNTAARAVEVEQATLVRQQPYACACTQM
jgi:GTPase SAR1 family protein